jgi:Lon protease-like protein
MAEGVVGGFPLFPLGIVALPGEAVPLHIFEDRYKRMIERCLEGEPGTLDRAFGVIWLSDEELKGVGCACEVERVLERLDDGRLNILARGSVPFRLLNRQDDLPYPAGVVELLDETEEEPDGRSAETARQLYSDLVRQATDREIDPEELSEMGAYGMAGTVEFAPEAKQELLELRSENARMALLGRLLESAIDRLALLERAQERARSNGKVRFV